MNKAKQNLPYTIFMILVLITGSVYLFSDSMDLYPNYVHSWTQSDRLAIAMRFQENGYDFFHPSTYNLLTKDGITQVDFPIHDYLVAVISGVFHWNIISTFRYYELIYSLIGLFFLFRSTHLLSRSPLKGILVTCTIATLPFFAYYQNGFLPSIPSYANFCIGLFFFIKYLKQPQLKSYAWSIFFMSLAALARIPFSIFLFALLAQRALTFMKKKEFKLFEFTLPLLGLMMVAFYYVYNQMLAEQYGSMFLSEFMHPESLGGFFEIFLKAAERWSGQFLSSFHWLIIILLAVGLIKFRRRGAISSEISEITSYGWISLIGTLAYFLLMGLQFVDHDYYYIDSYLPAFTILLLLSISLIEIPSKTYTTVAVILFISLIGSYGHAADVLKERYSKDLNSFNLYSFEAFQSLEKDMDKWGVNAEDTLAFFDIGSTNVPFTLLKNKGYTSLSSGSKSCQILLDQDFEYAFILDSTKVSDSYFDYPEIAEQLRWMGSNGLVSYYQKSKSSDHHQFFKSLIYQFRSNFDETEEDTITRIAANSIRMNDTSNLSLHVDSINEYILTTTLEINEEHLGKDLNIAVNFDLLSLDSAKGLQYIISIPDYYFPFFIESEIEKNKGWQNIALNRRIPSKYLLGGTELKIYLWNQQHRINHIDNYHLIIYQ